MKFFGGIEGGATHSRLVIVDESGECVATSTGLGTNHWMIGIQECARRIAEMVQKAKKEAAIEQTTRLTSLGLSLSGCEQEATNIELELELHRKYPDVAENYFVGSDTMGSIFTTSPIGGMVVISGTGSNALLKNPDGSSFSCGGWGNFLGDEGSAWYISHRAMKIVFDDMDNFSKSPFPVHCVWDLIKEHFKVESRLDLLPHCYAKFEKHFYASLCKKLAQAADEGDKLSLHLFKEAGQHIARSIHALLPFVHEDLVKSGDLNIVCVGSVWLSWHLLRDGFIKELNREPISYGLNLVNITKSAAFGACYLGTDRIKYDLRRNYNDNYKVMYHYKSNALPINGENSKKGQRVPNGLQSCGGATCDCHNCKCNSTS